MTFEDDFGQKLYSIHSPIQCAGRPCTIHRPSNHHMRDWPLHWRADRRIFERICPHRIGHPDPDDDRWQVEYLENVASGIHSCDGCCRPPVPSSPPEDLVA